MGAGSVAATALLVVTLVVVSVCALEVLLVLAGLQARQAIARAMEMILIKCTPSFVAWAGECYYEEAGGLR